MKKQVNLIVSVLMLSMTSYAGEGSVGSNACCIQSALDNENEINHSGKSSYCVNNNAEEMPEVSSNVFQILKHGYTFRIDLNQVRENSISITNPDGKIQSTAEENLFIGTFGSPQYQYSSELASSFRLDCGQR